MRDLFLAKLKDICENYQFTKEDKLILVNEANRMVMLARAARREGLLALISLIDELDDIDLYTEYGLSKIDGRGFERYLQELIELVTDGTDFDIIEKIGELTFCTSGFSPMEYIRYAMFLEATLNIQCGVNPELLEKIMLAYLPVKARKLYIEKQKEERKKEKISLDEYFCDIIDKEYDLEYPEQVKEQVEEKFEIFMMLDDVGMQCLNKNIKLDKLAVALKGMPVSLKRRFFDNLPKNQRLVVAENMQFMGPIRLKDAKDEIDEIFKVLQRLEDCGEIYIQKK